MLTKRVGRSVRMSRRPSVVHDQAAHPAREFAQQAQAVFDKAARRVGLVERFYRIAGQKIVLRFAGDALVPILTPAFDHLQCPRFDDPDLKVSLFDSATTQVVMPPPPWGQDAYGPNGQIAGFNTHEVQTVYNVGTSILNVMDHTDKSAVFSSNQRNHACAQWRTLRRRGDPERTRSGLSAAGVHRR